MAFWDADLTTRMGAESAAFQGGLGCFIYSGMAVLGLVFFGGVNGFDTPEGIAGIAGVGAEVLVTTTAGFRLRAGKGAFWGSAAALIVGLELLFKLISLSINGGLIIGAVVLVVIVQGVRGAFALRSANGFAEDDAEVFL